MKTYLELEGKLGPKPRLQPKTQSQPSTITPSQSNKPLTRETPGPKMAEKKRRTRVLAKKKIQGEGNFTTHIYHPNANCTSDLDPNCTYPNSSHYLHPNTCGKISSHVHSGDSTQFGKGKI